MEKTQVNAIRNKKEEIIKDTAKIKIINYFTNLYNNKLQNSEEIDCDIL